MLWTSVMALGGLVWLWLLLFVCCCLLFSCFLYLFVAPATFVAVVAAASVYGKSFHVAAACGHPTGCCLEGD